ncbi:DUF4870 domain-containing protein [Limosilactobacillus pontis]|jgi:uncharacterized Tic20 family protein|uniref:DUF4870 domain-containing protein n=1 Tax=Limosilactobacillus pontis TaxID=35787 RepID=A0ABT7UXB2_9LACO|nr:MULTISPECIES: DUF4870 domain-containing protein [Limosilactobacillus]MDM8266351.1 DUF4870 domain-containing protein [Limosilactobacillus pontis]MDM8331164.1 DUF4870 domain-containing protein [Limosilactobacillus pontis]HJA74485.1 DUF4870 domain-containing protein [Candidatus Limosilactobacillus gallistercoris]
MQSNTTTRIVNALSYLSILFLPVIFPLIVWIVARASDDPTISKNARKAFWSQLFPLLYVIFAILTMSIASLYQATFHAGALFGILLTFALLIALLLFIYNIAMAVKMLLGRE